jgi:molybdopterin-guanine dinucleotide biosynthesis protein A
VAGIFVGGQSSRMGGIPKGLLLAPSGETLVGRWSNLFGALSIPIVLVGQNPAYDALAIEQIADVAPGIGPLGGLVALLEHAGAGTAMAVACDMPFVSRALVEKLVHHPSTAPALAPCDGALWQPLFARFRAADALGPAKMHLSSGIYSLQALLDRLNAARFELDPGEQGQLRDWDTVADRKSDAGSF